MSLWRALRWSTAGFFLLLIAIATYAAAISERDFFGDYPLVALSQGWVALVVTGPLLAGWAAWDTARIMPWLDATFAGAHRAKALSGLTAPALLLGVLLPLAIVTYVAGWPPGPTTALVTISAGATLIAAASLGSAVGSILPRLVAVPTAAAAVYAVLALGVADPTSAVGRVTLPGLVAPCCNNTEQIGSTALIFASVLGTLVTLGSLITLGGPRERRWRVVSLASTILIVLAAGRLVSQNVSVDDTIVARESATHCRKAEGLEVCVWPEHSAEREMATTTIAQGVKVASSLGVKLPNRWSEDPAQGGATFMWTNVLADEEHRYALGIDIAHYVGCTDIGEDAPVGILFAEKMGGAPAYMRQRGSAADEQLKEITSLTPAEQSKWLANHVKTCRT